MKALTSRELNHSPSSRFIKNYFKTMLKGQLTRRITDTLFTMHAENLAMAE
jgi:hypothetical protein